MVFGQPVTAPQAPNGVTSAAHERARRGWRCPTRTTEPSARSIVVTVAAIVPAAGRGAARSGQPKALRTLDGVPMLVYAVQALAQARLVELVVVAAPPDGVAEVEALLASHDIGNPCWSWPAVSSARIGGAGA